MATKAEGKQWLAEAEQNGQLYRIKSGWKGMMIFAGVLTCLLVITLPLGIWMFFVAKNARVGITDKGFAISWFGTSAFRWDELEAFRPVALNFHVHGGGLVGALVGVAASAAVSARTEGLKGPLGYKLKGKRMFREMPAHAIENSVAMAQEMEKHSGLTIFPKAEGEATAEAEAKA
ncbi:MAG: hypothetical protein EP329_01530 [Deltaproteobacteria bacterium]|nr:MAG: hypothetical protein EP329_01530 [Deltaproteobacteria bacterium]